MKNIVLCTYLAIVKYIYTVLNDLSNDLQYVLAFMMCLKWILNILQELKKNK